MKLFLIIQIYSVSLYMVTMLDQVLLSTSEFPMTVFWKVCTRCEYESATPNNVGNVRTRNLSRSVEAECSEVEDHGEETQRNFKVRNERIETGVLGPKRSVNFSTGTLRHTEIQ